MFLPHAEVALIPEPKIVQYLLNLEHLDGRSKAAFFLEFGFSPLSWQVFADALRVHAVNHEISATESNAYGVKYTVDGQLGTPNGESPHVRVIWFMEAGEEIPRLVTAHPLPRKVE